jgi:hypothetical protein
MSPLVADFAAKVFLHSQSKFLLAVHATSPEDKLAGDLGNVIEATSTGRSSVGFFCSRKISTGQFGTFATKLARTSRPVVSPG